jgi:FKBP-type peptidyl-prolyl cis-trans isomerase (trigger factor)
VTIDLHGNDASGAEVVGVDDYLYEVGTGTVVAELDNELHGAKAGAILAFDAANPAEPDERVAFRVLVKEVKD